MRAAVKATGVVVPALLFIVSCEANGGVERAAETAQKTEPPPLRELAWIAPDADAVEILSRSPADCLRAAETPDAAYLVRVGEAAFESPFLFGGQAARARLSCASCHVGGAGNEAFYLDGLSSAPGTADVTSAVFSKVREDGVFNPVPIPSLIGVAENDAFGTAAPSATLHGFIKSAVVEEFQGEAPSAVILDGLAAYVAHLDERACDEESGKRTVASDMDNALRRLAIVRAALDRKDFETADFLILATQDALARIHERYERTGLGDQRARLRETGRMLSSIRSLLATAPETARKPLADVETRMTALRTDLESHESRSLYDMDILRAALQ